MDAINNSNKQVLYITGRGGSLDKGLAVYLKSLSNGFEGIALDVAFLRQPPDVQVEHIQSKILEDSNRVIIANSYGAYLTLQAMVGLNSIKNSIVLLSPVLGVAQARDRMYMSRPPLTKRLQNSFFEGDLGRPKRLSVFIGKQDELFCKEQINLLNDYFGKGAVTTLDGESHNLSHTIVKEIVSATLEVSNDN